MKWTLIFTFSFIAILSAFILLIDDLLGPNQTSAIILNEQKGFPKLVLVFTSGDSRQNSHSSTSVNFTQIPQYLKDIAIPSKGCLA